jgi:hypothetical protein
MKVGSRIAKETAFHFNIAIAELAAMKRNRPLPDAMLASGRVALTVLTHLRWGVVLRPTVATMRQQCHASVQVLLCRCNTVSSNKQSYIRILF